MILDTCTTWTVVNTNDILTKLRSEQGRLTGSTKGDYGAEITQAGTLIGHLKHQDETTDVILDNVKVAYEVEEPMLRPQELMKMGLRADFEKMRIYNRETNKVAAIIEEDEYRLPYIWMFIPERGRSRRTTMLEHRQRGHLGEGNNECNDCRTAKLRKRKLKRTEGKKKYDFGEILSMDTDVMSKRSIEGYLYRQDVIDHATCWMWGVGLKRRNEHENFIRDILAETKGKITEFRVDGAKEFGSSLMHTLSREFQFRLKRTARYTHEHAGKVERAHQTVDQMARAMMNTAGLPHDLFCNLASQAAIFTKNRMPTKGNEHDLSPYEARYGIKPDLGKLKVFGCKACVYVSKEAGRRKMENSGEEGMFVGYADDGAGYLIMDLKNMQTRTEGIVTFYQNEFPGKEIEWSEIEPDDGYDENYVENPELMTDSEEDIHDDEESGDSSEEDDIPALSAEHENEAVRAEEPQNGVRRSNRVRQAPSQYWMVSRATKEERTKLNYKQAMASNDKEIYRKEIVAYLQDLLNTEALEIVKRPTKRIHTIGSRWVCYRKYVDGKFVKMKVRWTPLGFMQRKGVDYSETFAPVALSASNRLIYVIASRWNRKVKKGDVVNAFQRTANTQHTIYAELCEGMEMVRPECNKKDYVMKLNNAINGTKQSGKEFNDKLDRILTTQIHMRRIPGDACLYSIGDEQAKTQLIAVFHVDDYQYVGMTDEVEANFVKKMQKFLPSKVGEICKEHLGVAIAQKEDGSTEFVQSSKIEEYCEQFQVSGATQNIRTMNFNGVKSSEMKHPQKYPKAMGCINYLVQNSRPDVMPLASILASYSRKPSKATWKGVTDLLAYLKGTKARSLTYRKPRSDEKILKIEGYCDASYNSPNENLETKKTRSRAGYLLFVNGCLIKWYSKLIRLTAQSTEEAEVIAANELVRDVKWLTGILSDLRIPFAKPRIFCDSDNAISWIKNRGVTDRTKHFETKLNLVRESYQQQEFLIERVAGAKNPADLMTKQLERVKTQQHCEALGLLHSEDGTRSKQQLGGSVSV